MNIGVSGQIPVTKPNGEPTGLTLNVNATTPQIGSRNWESGKKNSTDPDNGGQGPTLKEVGLQTLGTAAALALCCLL